ncbi:MAG TPA: hypothetical protein VFQ35_02655 [Polyangiaceae bacterium]|nr:hypothetical protein [Polyangiaceae bacterium]
MKLSDIVSALHLSIFAEVPLIICFGIFLGVVLPVMRSREEFEQMRTLPLRNDEPETDPTRRQGGSP